MAPLVSVLVPVFNARAYVREAVESLQAQTHADWEAVVVDDGSTDGSGELVLELAAGDDRIRVHRQERGGVAAARNAALERSAGELVAFLDADDAWLPHKLERQLAAWREGVLYGDAYLVEGERPPSERIGDHIRFARGDVFSRLVDENVVPLVTALVPRDLVERAGRFDETLRGGCEDYDLWLRLAEAGVPFDYVDEPLALYRVREDGLSRDAVRMARARLGVYERLAARSSGERRALVESRAAAERRDLAGSLRQRAWRETAAGDLEGARRDLREAHAGSPSASGSIATALALRSDAALRTFARWRGAEQSGRRLS